VCPSVSIAGNLSIIFIHSAKFGQVNPLWRQVPADRRGCAETQEGADQGGKCPGEWFRLFVWHLKRASFTPDTT